VLLETGFKLPNQDIILALDRVALNRKLPASITEDHGTEFTSLVMDDWTYVNLVSLAFTEPGKLSDNGFCESFNGRFRDESLNFHDFNTIEEVKRIIEAWRCD
jgi:putative transposase